jgi:electron transfer flavoprotein beta subunit
MRIALITRYAPEPATVELAGESGKLDNERLLYKLGRADAVALEQAVQLAETAGGTVTAFCVAPPAADKLLKGLYAGGANEVVRLWAENLSEAGVPEMTQAQMLANALKAQNFDLVIGGAIGMDGNSDVIGPALAAYLDLPQVCNVVRLELRPENKLYTERKLERGAREALLCNLPALVTMAEGSLEPRYPSMPAYLAALRRPVDLRRAEAVKSGATAARTVTLTAPRPRPKKLPRPSDTLPYYQRIDAILTVTGGDKKGNIFEGSADELAERIVNFLVSNKLL